MTTSPAGPGGGGSGPTGLCPRVSSFGAVPGIVIYGTHGAERWENGLLRAPTPPPGLGELRLRLPALVTSITRDCAIWIEEKALSLVIHTRLTAEPDRFLDALRAPVAEASAAAGLEVRPGGCQDPAEDPAVQRAPYRQAEAVRLDRRDHLALDVADGQVVDRLLIDQAEKVAGARFLLCPGDVPAGEVRRADVEDLALGAENSIAAQISSHGVSRSMWCIWYRSM